MQSNEVPYEAIVRGCVVGSGAGLHVVWHRCVVDARDHAVTDQEFTSGRYKGEGRYVAVCGHVVYPGSMLDAPGPPCRRCQA